MFLLDTLISWSQGLRDNPVLLILLITAPVAVIAFWRRVYPSVMLVAALSLPAVATIGLLFWEGLLPLILLIDACLAALALADLFLLPRVRDFSVERECQKIASLNKKHLVTITVSNRSLKTQVIQVRDDVPQEFEPSPSELEVSSPPRSRSSVSYEFRASRRGAFQFDFVYLLFRSRLGLWKKLTQLPAESAVNVYPDMKQLGQYALLARTNRLSLMGVRRTRRIGQDNEFERLRDYTHDDNYKHIDWRSTARRNKLTVKDFQANQSQRLIFLVDCGRMMTNEAGGISLLDHSLNAMLMLGYVALDRGDSVGLLTFSDRVHSFIPPKGGRSQMNHLLHAAYDRFPTLVESGYQDAFLYLSARCRKRSLVVLITNLIDEVNAQQVYEYLSTISRHHLALAVVLKDHQLFDAAEEAQKSRASIYRAAAAAEIICWRQQIITDLQHQGVLVLDAFPEKMTAPLINQYLDIKARHLL